MHIPKTNNDGTGVNWNYELPDMPPAGGEVPPWMNPDGSMPVGPDPSAPAPGAPWDVVGEQRWPRSPGDGG